MYICSISDYLLKIYCHRCASYETPVAARRARHLLLASQGPALPWLQAPWAGDLWVKTYDFSVEFWWWRSDFRVKTMATIDLFEPFFFRNLRQLPILAIENHAYWSMFFLFEACVFSSTMLLDQTNIRLWACLKMGYTMIYPPNGFSMAVTSFFKHHLFYIQWISWGFPMVSLPFPGGWSLAGRRNLVGQRLPRGCVGGAAFCGVFRYTRWAFRDKW